MQEVREVHTQFEAVKIAMTQDKNGHILKMAIHPNDTPESIMRDPVGTKYMVVLVRMNDEGEPVASQTDEDAKKAIQIAGILCTDEKFQQWLVQIGEADELSEMAATVALRRILKITSRKELKVDSAARQRLLGLRDEFVRDLKAGRLL